MTRRHSRRTFLKTGAAAGGGMLLSAPTVFARTREGATEKMNIGMIGCGGKGQANYMAFMGQRQKIVAMCDVDHEREGTAMVMNPLARKYHDYREMLETETDLDAVIVSIPDHSHAAAAIRAMRRGLHVYCEKPMARTLHEVRMMKKVAAETGVMTQMGNQGHSATPLRQALEVIRSGAIGNVSEVHCWTNRPSWPQPVDPPTEAMEPPPSLKWDLWLGPAAERDYHSCYLPRVWRAWYDFGTCALGDMGCHIIDLPYWALELGAPLSAEVEMEGANEHTGPDWSIIHYKFAARGDKPPVDLYWYDGGKQPDPALIGGEPLEENGSILVGDEGTMYVPDTYARKFRLLPEEKFANYENPAPLLPRVNSHYAEFVDGCLSGTQPLSNFMEYGSALTEVLHVGNLAMRLGGGKVEWDAANARVVGRPEADALIHPTFRDGWVLDPGEIKSPATGGL